MNMKYYNRILFLNALLLLSTISFAQQKEYFSVFSVGFNGKFNTIEVKEGQIPVLMYQELSGLDIRGRYILNKNINAGIGVFYSPRAVLGISSEEWKWVGDYGLDMESLDLSLDIRLQTNRYKLFSAFLDAGGVLKQANYYSLGKYTFEGTKSGSALGFKAGIGVDFRITQFFRWEIFHASFEFINENVVFPTGPIDDDMVVEILGTHGFASISTSLKFHLVRKKF